jgi:exopolysaccharide biosynthesis polyprenyl glycosylphosphotransferase
MHSSIDVSGPRHAEAVADLRVAKTAEKRSTANRFRRIVVACEVLADLCTIILAVRLGYFVYGAMAIGKHIHFPPRPIWAVAAVLAGVMVLMLDRVGAYRRGNSLLRVRETEQIIRVSTEALLAVLGVSFFTSVLFPRWLVILCLSLVPLLLFVQKTVMYLLIHALHARGYGNERVLIYGAGYTGRRMFSVFKGSPKLGLVPVAVADDDRAKIGTTLFEMSYGRRCSTPIVEGPVTRELIAAHAVDLVIIAVPSLGREKFIYTVGEALAANARVSFVPSHLISPDSWVDYRDIDGILLASLAKPARRTWYELSKRVIDILGSLALIVLGAPVFLVLAALVRLDSKGPALFRQERVGQHGKPFRMYKFRSMGIATSAYDYSPRESCDPRITGVGRFLRRTSLDELPQLFNVLQGTMSLVGPRPEMPFIVKRYTEHHRLRLHVKPGITGLWQLSGDRAFLIHENIEYDLYYIRHRNMFMDIAVLLHTAIFAMRGV